MSILADRFGAASMPRTRSRVPTATMSSETAKRIDRRSAADSPRTNASEPRWYRDRVLDPLLGAERGNDDSRSPLEGSGDLQQRADARAVVVRRRRAADSVCVGENDDARRSARSPHDVARRSTVGQAEGLRRDSVSEGAQAAGGEPVDPGLGGRPRRPLAEPDDLADRRLGLSSGAGQGQGGDCHGSHHAPTLAREHGVRADE